MGEKPNFGQKCVTADESIVDEPYLIRMERF